MLFRYALLALVSLPIAVAAQEYPALSGKAAALAGYPYGLKAGLQLSLSARHEIGASYLLAARGSASLPEGYGQTVTPFAGPLQKLNAATFTYTYTAARFGKDHRAALRFEGGLILGEHRSAFNFQRDINRPGPDYAYTWDLKREFSAGIILAPEISWRFNRILSGGFGPYAILTKQLSGGGITLSLSLGRG